MARRIAPALRAAIGGWLGGDAEEKAITLGTTFSSTVSAGAWGVEGRADGWDLATVVTEGYERSVWAYRCIEKMSTDASRLRFILGRNFDRDDREVLDDHPLYRLLNVRANPIETGQQFKKRAVALSFISKKGVFVEVGRTRGGTPNRLDLLSPDRVNPVPDPHGDYISYFEFTRRDGAVRQIAPERVIWVREPHPSDPFSGVSPLEAAGMSIELDWLSRFYNVSFLKNDGRPGGVIGIDTSTLGEQELDRIQRRFAPGVSMAGRVVPIGTGPNGFTYTDLSSNPRDMAYQEASKNARDEILAAMGVGESMLGNAAGRTFDNAEQENYNYWAETMPPVLDRFALPFAAIVADTWVPRLDTSVIPALEIPRRRARQEALMEVQAGLRTIDEYRPLAGLTPIGAPQTRALWLSPALAPIPTQPEDAAALGLTGGDDADAPGVPADGSAAAAVQEAAAGGPGPSGMTAADAVQEAVGEGADGPARQAVAQATAQPDTAGQPGPAAAAVAEATEGKALPDDDLYDYPTAGPGVELDDGPGDAERLHVGVAGAVDALLARQQAVIAARLDSPKTRKGTRFWEPAPGEAPGQEPLDAERVVDAERWADDLAETLQPLAQDAGFSTAAALLAGFAAAGAVNGMVEGSSGLAMHAGAAAVEPVMTAITLARGVMGRWCVHVTEEVRSASMVAGGIGEVADAVEAHRGRWARDMADEVAGLVSAAVVNGAREAVARRLRPATADVGVVRSWLTQADGQVRPSHVAVAGTTLPVGERFQVGVASLRYPGDPYGPVEESAGCRCRLVYRCAPGAKFTLPDGVAGTD